MADFTAEITGTINITAEVTTKQVVPNPDGTILLSDEATAAVANIEGNGGSLTDFEKCKVGVWVDRMVANGDWAVLNSLIYGGFADDLCNVVDWVSGTVAELDGTASHSGGGWLFPLAADFLRTNFVPSEDSVYGALNNYKTGAYLISSPGYIFSPIDIEGGGTPSNRLRMIASDEDTWSLQVSATSASKPESNPPILLNNRLYSIAAKDDSPDQVEAWTNGAMGAGGTAAIFEYPQGSVQVGKNSAGSIFNMFYNASYDIDLADFTTGFDIFNETIATGWNDQVAVYGRGYHLPPATQVSPYRDGDEEYIERTIITPLRVANTLKVFNEIDPTDWLKLLNTNSFGNLDHFTDINGLQVYGDDLVMDHYTKLMWYRVSITSAVWNSGIDNALASVQGGYSNWFIPSIKQLESIVIYEGASKLLDYAPFLINDVIPTSTTDRNTTSNYLYLRNVSSLVAGIFDSEAKTTSRKQIMCRVFD